MKKMYNYLYNGLAINVFPYLLYIIYSFVKYHGLNTLGSVWTIATLLFSIILLIIKK